MSTYYVQTSRPAPAQFSGRCKLIYTVYGEKEFSADSLSPDMTAVFKVEACGTKDEALAAVVEFASGIPVSVTLMYGGRKKEPLLVHPAQITLEYLEQFDLTDEKSRQYVYARKVEVTDWIARLREFAARKEGKVADGVNTMADGMAERLAQVVENCADEQIKCGDTCCECGSPDHTCQECPTFTDDDRRLA